MTVSSVILWYTEMTRNTQEKYKTGMLMLSSLYVSGYHTREDKYLCGLLIISVSSGSYPCELLRDSTAVFRRDSASLDL